MTAKPFCDGPFSILKGTNWIVGKDHHGDICHVLDQRGWGYLTGKGQSALGLDSATASLMQADMQQWVVDALNDAWNRRADLAAVPAQVRVKPLVFDDLGIASDNLLNETIVYRKPEDQDRHNAKRAARILAAIEPQPDPRDEVIKGLVEALKSVIGQCSIDREIIANALETAKAVMK